MGSPTHNVSLLLVHFDLPDFPSHSPSQCGGDLVEPCLCLPCTRVQLVWRTPGRVYCGDYDPFQDNSLLGAGVLLRWLCSRA